jgi:hypothetical protein
MQSTRSKKVSLADLVVLIHAIGQAQLDPEVGFVDSERTFTELLRELSPFVYVREDILESALAHANYLDEKGKFSDFRGNTFDQLVKRVAAPKGFNKDYNYFTDK